MVMKFPPKFCLGTKATVRCVTTDWRASSVRRWSIFLQPRGRTCTRHWRHFLCRNVLLVIMPSRLLQNEAGRSLTIAALLGICIRQNAHSNCLMSAFDSEKFLRSPPRVGDFRASCVSRWLKFLP